MSGDVVFDPALDCVAAHAALAAQSLEAEPWRYRHAWPSECGSPLYVLAARALPAGAELGPALVDMESHLPGRGPIALGVAPVAGGATVVAVAARRVIQIEPLARDGAHVLRGRVAVEGEALEAIIATSHGVTRVNAPLHAGQFEIDLGEPRDARVELTVRAGLRHDPVGRFDLGAGAELFSSADARDATSFLAAVNAARRSLGRPSLSPGGPAGDCDTVPARSGDDDIAGRAWCFEVPRLGVGPLAREVAYRPMLLEGLLTPDAVVLELSATEEGASARVLRRFEALTPEAGRQRVVAALRERWPSLREQGGPKAALSELLAEWASSSDLQASSSALKPKLDRIAAGWSKTKRFYTGLVGSRELERALSYIRPETTPVAVDAVLVQVRRPDGAMWDLIAVLLELP